MHLVRFSILILLGQIAVAQDSLRDPTPKPIEVSGVFPQLAMVANHTPRTEAGTGALMAWADRLWIVTYVAHKKDSGSGTGLYQIDGEFTLQKRPESVVGTYANRMVHAQSNQMIMGPYVIDTEGRVRVITSIVDFRLAATMEHLSDPRNKVYFLGMEGEFLEVDVHTLESRLLYNLVQELALPEGAKPHFKSAFTAHGRVVVANNTYNQQDYSGRWQAGRLAEWDGASWKIIDRNAYTEVWCPKSFGNALYAIGWDNASALLMVHTDLGWTRYRLPKASHAWDETSTTEWMRIREVETERGLMDCHGMFYELPYHAYAGKIWGIRPISTHLRVVPDFCSWRGLLVLGGNQATPMWFGESDRNLLGGQPQAGLWFGKTDDLWDFGKAKGYGGVWRDSPVQAGEPSDPFLMNGFEGKVLHLQNQSADPVRFTVEVDFLGNGTWVDYEELEIAGRSYTFHVFPAGFSAEWVRLKASSPCQATAWFVYN